MKWLSRINLVLLVLLSISTGMVKIFQMPEEMALFARLGFPAWLTIALGVVQATAGIALISARFRRAAAGVLLPTYVLGTVALFAGGIMVFGFASFLFLAMAALPLWPATPARATAAAAAA